MREFSLAFEGRYPMRWMRHSCHLCVGPDPDPGPDFLFDLAAAVEDVDDDEDVAVVVVVAAGHAADNLNLKRNGS